MMIRRTTLFCFLWLLHCTAQADGMVVDKVYHPYVLPYEREVEWRVASHNTDEGNQLQQRLGLGHSLSEYLAVEGYLIGERDENSDFGLQAYELEVRWMITEQGQYWADWGMLFEIERDNDKDNWEAATALLMEKEFGRTSVVLNAFVIYEWGIEVENEWEMEVRGQYRYRWKPQFQPALELYSGEDFVGIGPGFAGIQRFDGQKQLKWDAGFITEIAHHGRDNTFRLALEYEF